MRYGKLINNELVYFRDSEIKLKTTIVEGKPVRQMLTDELRNQFIIDNGYKEVVISRQTASISKWDETDTQIVQVWYGEPVKTFTGNIPVKQEKVEKPIVPVVKPEPTADELRKKAYATEKIVDFENELITVDKANLRFLQLLAEGKETDVLRGLIVNAKTMIRNKYPE